MRDPELDLSLAEAGMVRAVRTRRHRAEVELALPVDGLARARTS